ncbi:hypothetical protein IAI10_05685 [Clostridium sp. 19966]|uniref:cohesin domain-containing protein n=1 Tax=Clostridium sp. 19966 TaxID=2768166 RepID=UPI0028DF5A67|nr:cohesin domain-containing protein [Clostridium sp. 19966]MDT8716139.1 hypothetical protein [Clostridium sp. 19966]
MRKSKIFKLSTITIIFLFAATIFPSALKVQAATNTTISYSVDKSTVNVGDTFNIYVNLGQVQDLYGASMDFKFDSSLFSVNSVSQGTAWGSETTNPSYNSSQASSGYVEFFTTLQGNRSGLTTTAASTLFVINATAKKAGSQILKTISTNDDLSATGNNVRIKLSDSNGSAIGYTSTDYTVSINSIQPLSAGSYEETNSNLTYVGTWSSESNSGYSGGSAKISNSNGSYVSFSFTGTGFRWYGLAGPNIGNAIVTIDGNSTTIDNYSASNTFKKVVYEKTGLSSGTHTVKIQVSSNKNASAKNCYQVIDSLEILNDSSSTALSAGSYEETNSNLTYVGTWSSESNSGYSGGSAKISNSNGSYVSFSFTGTGFRWYGLAGPNIGNAIVTIDGNSTTIDNYSASNTFKKVVYEKTGLSSGTHTVKIQVSSNKNASAKNCYQAIDSLEILNDSSSTALSVGSYEETNSNLTYVGTWSSESNSGYSGGSAKISNSNGSYVSFSFTGTGFRWYGLAGPNIGNAIVTIDGNSTTIDNYSASNTFKKVVYEKTGLSSGTHTVKIQVSSNKNASAKNCYQAIDSLEVLQ